MATLAKLLTGKEYEGKNKDNEHEFDFVATYQVSKKKANRRLPPPESECDELLSFIHRELQLTGLDTVKPPSLERLRVFQTAYDLVAERVPVYKPILGLIRDEYDAVLNYLIETNNSAEALKGRLKLVKIESTKFVTEANYHFHSELSQLRAEITRLETMCKEMDDEKWKSQETIRELRALTESAERQANDLHRQNFDVVKNFQRTQQLLEEARRKDVQIQAEVNVLKLNLKSAALHIKKEVEKDLLQDKDSLQKTANLDKDKKDDSSKGATRQQTLEVESVGSLDGFKSIVKSNDKVAVMFTESEGGPYQQIKPVFKDKCPTQHPKIKFILIDGGENEENQIAMECEVDFTPTFMFYRDGNPIKELTLKGADEAKLQESLSKL